MGCSNERMEGKEAGSLYPNQHHGEEANMTGANLRETQLSIQIACKTEQTNKLAITRHV